MQIEGHRKAVSDELYGPGQANGRTRFELFFELINA